MRERIQYIGVASSAIKSEISSEFDLWLDSLNLFENKRGRGMIDLAIRIQVEPIPSSLEEGEKAILVSNYPSVTGTTNAVLKVGCRLPGERARLKAIARGEIVTQAGRILSAIGIRELVFPARKDETGAYKLESKKVFGEILGYLQKPGHVLWLSITGETRNDGLGDGDIKNGAVVFSNRRQAPIVPMGIITKERKGKRKVVAVRFGKSIGPPKTSGLSEFEKSDFFNICSRQIACEIARLLPPGQRGDFEDAEDRLIEIEKRLETYTTA